MGRLAIVIVIVACEAMARVREENATIAVPVFISLPILSETVRQECRALHRGVK